MAKFNPDVPDTNDPNYFQYSRAISPYEGDKSGGIIAKGMGDIFHAAITGADEVIKSVIDTGLRRDLQKERDVQTGALETIAGLPSDLRVSPYQGTTPENAGSIRPDAPPSDIIPGSVAAPVPSQMQALDRSVASANTGQLTKPAMATYYTGKLDVIAKDYRSQFPGYADYIDQKVASITGGNPANERIKDLMTMIQQSQSKDHAETEKALSFIGSAAKYPGAPQAANVVSSGIKNPMAYAINWVHEWEAIDYKTDRQIKLNTAWKGTNENLVTQNEQEGAGIANDISKKMWTDVIEGVKMSSGDLEQIAQNVQTGKSSVPPAQAELYGQAVEAMGKTARLTMEDRLNRKGEDGKSIADRIGPEKTKSILDQATARYTNISQMFLNKDTGSAFTATRFVERQSAENAQWLLKDSPQRDFFNFLSAGTKLGGPGFTGLITADFVGGKYGQVDDTVKQYSVFNTARMLTQPNAPLEQVIIDMQKKGVGNSKPDAASYEYFTNELPAKIADPKVNADQRRQLAENVFNGNITAKFDNDTFDKDGKLIPGKHTILNNMTKDEIRDSVWELSGKGQGQLWQQYKNFVVRNSTENLTGDVKDINDLTVNPNIRFTWDTETHKLGIDFKDTFFVNPYSKGDDRVAQAQAESYRKSVAFVNSSLQPIVGIAKKEGIDANMAVFQQLTRMGLDPKGVGLPNDMLKAIIGPPTEKKTDEKHGEIPSSGFWASREDKLDPFVGAARDFFKGVIQPKLEDWTKSKVEPANPEQIKGTANAAHISPEWGNPLSPTFRENHLTDIKTPGGASVTVNKQSAEAFSGFLKDLEDTGYKIDSIGGYNLREKKTVGGISQHAFGNAIDVNPAKNPYVGNPMGVGKMKSDLPKEIADIAAKWGVTWGGDWKSIKDPMHFEYTGRKPEMKGEPGYKVSQK